jgi:hypothetical protein
MNFVGCRDATCSVFFFGVYRVDRCVKICILLLWPNLSTAVRTLEALLHPSCYIRVVLFCHVTRPGGSVFEVSCFHMGSICLFGTLPLVDRITQGTKLKLLTVYQEPNQMDPRNWPDVELNMIL